MRFSALGVAGVALLAVAASGCTSSRFTSVNTAPEPLAPAPSGTVSSSSLPPPAQPNQFPTAPPPMTPDPNATDMAAVDPGAATPPVSAPDVTAGSVTGVWKASVSGGSCQLATSLTKRGPNNRAAPLRCPAPVDTVMSWNVAGKQLTLYDGNGSAVARLYSSGSDKFDGQTETGVPISLTR